MATLTTRSLDSVMTALETRLRAAQWGSVAAFREVGRFVSDDLIQAFTELVAVQDRVCIIAATGVEWESQDPEQPLSFFQRTARISLLCSDSVLSDATAAIWGTATNPGAWRLAEIAVGAACGLLLNNPAGVIVRPAEQTPMSVVDLKKRLPGRVIVAADIEAVGGTLVEEIASPGPVA